MTSMEPIKIKPFDQYVAEAQRPPVELPLPDGTSLLIAFPDGKALRSYVAAMKTGDPIAMMISLLSVEDSQRLMALYETAPADVLGKIIADLEGAWGLRDAAALPGGSTG